VQQHIYGVAGHAVFVRYFLLFLTLKIFENWLKFDEVRVKKVTGLYFLDHSIDILPSWTGRTTSLCIFFCADWSTSSDTMSSMAMIGIVVGSLVMVFLLVAALILFLVCRRRILAVKPPQSRRCPVADARALQASGCGLPVDIPVEALAREPPPRYTSLDDVSTSSMSQRHDLSASVLPPPPPYSLQVHTWVTLGRSG